MNARAQERLHGRRRAAKQQRIQRATLGWAMAALILLAGGGLLADRLMDPAAFAIRELSFEGEFNHLEPGTLRRRVEQTVDANYFAIDLETIERAAESLDWVQRARVRRIWPDGLHIAVREHRLIARWGNDAWLNDEGEVVRVSVSRQAEELRLAGPNGHAEKVLRQAREWSAGLGGVGLELKALTLNERRAWYAVVSSPETGTLFSVALGRDGVGGRFRRFVKAFRALPGEKLQRIGHVDARYPNGIALRLKPSMNSEDST
ncbi:MAG: Cell division protein FtsQ [Gammaproteobacteria bacterium]|nr:Cell division protein FtsQ [Gammaproteobacteria bacterium]